MQIHVTQRKKRFSVAERFAKFVFRETADDTGCWLWQGACFHSGYASFWDGKKQVYAHRFSYESSVGPIPPGFQVDHLCRVRNCVNPAHLEPVTPQENVIRSGSPAIVGARNRSKTHCPAGHPYSGENLYVEPKGGKRQCRTCRAKRQVVRDAELLAIRARRKALTFDLPI